MTRNQRLYVEGIAKEVQAAPLDLGRWFNFRTGGQWDIKGKPGIPPSEYHWGMYKGKLVNDMYLANHAFGYASASAGFPLDLALGIGQGFAFWQRRPGGDQPEDQAAIVSGWWERHTGNPWPEGLPTPKYFRTARVQMPGIYIFWRENFSNMPVIERFRERKF